MPVAMRAGGASLPASASNATRPPAPVRPPLAPARAGPAPADGVSSAMVFHSPQDSQRPDHFGVTAPQD
jgi:hypothetical protein